MSWMFSVTDKSMCCFALILGLWLGVNTVWAYDLTLTNVGTTSTAGTDYSLVSYLGGIPGLSGTASPSAQVGVKIKTFLSYVTASSSGIWTFTPVSLDQGDNPIVLSSGTQSISFTLRFNSTVSGTLATPSALSSETSLPGAGVWEYYIPAFLIGTGVFWFGRYSRKKMQKWEKGD